MKTHYVKTALLAWLWSPLAAGAAFWLGLLLTLMMGTLPEEAIAAPPILALALIWARQAKRTDLPETASRLLAPIFLVFAYYLCAWIVFFELSRHRLADEFFSSGAFFLLTIPCLAFAIPFSGHLSLTAFPFAAAALTLIETLALVFGRRLRKRRMIFDKAALVHVLTFACLSGIAFFQVRDRRERILDEDSRIERVAAETNLAGYRPFSKDNCLKTLGEPATVSFHGDYPRLDGLAEVYPVYGALAQELYRGLDEAAVDPWVGGSGTDAAYQRLLNGEIDIFFGAPPSERQLAAAREKGLELSLTRIGREALVFLVRRDNPVTGLTLGQVRDIYAGKIANWRELGGRDGKILPFQRPEKSYSQALMLSTVMGEAALPEPLWEEYEGDSEETISRVAEYRNYSSAIGYSPRYFAAGPNLPESVKLLAIDGAEPTLENIRSGAYPLTAGVYAVTAGPPRGNSLKLLDWLGSEQGQRLIELCGYVGKG